MVGQTELQNFLYFVLVNIVGVVCHQLGLLGTDLHAVDCGDLLEPVNLFSSPAKPSMSSAKRRLIIVLPPMLTMIC